jgi:glycosyltransferase involved in cell wall biosynthesis
MRIAFYAPMKAPNHPVPSGDRLMARLLISALSKTGHEVELVSEFRSYSSDPDEAAWRRNLLEADAEIERVSKTWEKTRSPDLWFCYHPYYKSPDLLGRALTDRFGIPLITCEAALVKRRMKGPWASWQEKVLEIVDEAATNICMTQEDEIGILQCVPSAPIDRLHPFIDGNNFKTFSDRLHGEPAQIVSTAMMRTGAKYKSYEMLAKAFKRLSKRHDWRLVLIGDGPMRKQVEGLFADFPAEQVIFKGEQTEDQVAGILSESALYTWPGYSEAYGLAYLEAQAAGLPVIAQNTAGVPEVVIDGVTGILSPEGDFDAFAGSIERLIFDNEKREAMSVAARRFVLEERSLDRAASRLDQIIKAAVEWSLD